jgi:hypothetical protein
MDDLWSLYPIEAEGYPLPGMAQTEVAAPCCDASWRPEGRPAPGGGGPSGARDPDRYFALVPNVAVTVCPFEGIVMVS